MKTFGRFGRWAIGMPKARRYFRANGATDYVGNDY